MKQLILIAAGMVLLAACSDKALDSMPNDRYTEESYWTSEKNVTAALTGCYAALRLEGVLGGDATVLWEETATPNAYNYDDSRGFNSIALGTQTPTNAAIINARWRDCNIGLGRCNNFLAKSPAVPMDTALKARMTAEAKFLRALYYGMLETYYGGVPLILDAPDPVTQGKLPRDTRAAVVQQVLKDLDEAAAVLPVKYSGGDIGRATKGAAMALKARVLLFEASPLNNPSGNIAAWKQAADAAKAVMDLAGTGYGLFPDYRSLFLPANENSQESIFDVGAKIPELGNSFDLIDRQYNTNAPLRDIVDAYDMKDGSPKESSALYDPAKPYDNRDPRFYKSMVYPGDTYIGAVTTPTAPFKITGYGVKKYSIYDKEATTNLINQALRSETNYMYIRFADVLLMYAEAQNEVSGPDAMVYDAINRVRQRAGLVPYEIPATQTQASLRQLIRHERRVEFAFEGFYYTDIRRWKLAETVMNASIYNSENQPIVKRTFNKARDYWWPIPQTQRDLNPNLAQNDNY